jgi:hypothetical protein
MTNYNDGNWHGWNGGDRPVHPYTVVEVFCDGEKLTPGEADCFAWSKDGYADIVAFRVVKEHKEPEVIWVDDENTVWDDADIAISFGVSGLRKFVEVLE